MAQEIEFRLEESFSEIELAPGSDLFFRQIRVLLRQIVGLSDDWLADPDKFKAVELKLPEQLALLFNGFRPDTPPTAEEKVEEVRLLLSVRGRRSNRHIDRRLLEMIKALPPERQHEFELAAKMLEQESAA